MEHTDVPGDPQFRLEIVATFGDPLTRQLAEAVRIEKRGPDILNSKSEFSRCRVPRLKIDAEGWKKSSRQDEETNKKESHSELEETTLLNGLEKLEESKRRMEKKRKDKDKEDETGQTGRLG